MKKNKILVTGGNGFVGKALCHTLYSAGYDILCSVRGRPGESGDHECIVVESLDSNTDWRQALNDCDTVVHLAGRAHVLNDSVTGQLEVFRSANTSGTLNLAEQAAASGVSRFIFLSSIGVNGAITSGLPFNVNDFPSPHSPYAVSKLEAEVGLKTIAKRTNMDLVIIRSPAIYGKNSPGNFGLIEKFIKYGLPLPFGSIINKRSLVSITNVVDFILLCIEHKMAVNELLFVSDNQDLSTPEIVLLMGRLVCKKPKLVRFPLRFLLFFFNTIGKQKAGQSLMSDLQLDISRSQELLGWKPPFNPKVLIENSR